MPKKSLKVHITDDEKKEFLAQAEEYEILKKDAVAWQGSNICFDEQPHLQSKTTDLDLDAIKKLFETANKKITPHNAESLGLITKHGTKEFPSNGGIILFGTKRLDYFPEAIMRCARFWWEDKGTIIDQANIELYLPLALEETIKFVQKNTKLRSEIKTLTRKDIPEYPPIALREAIMNAIVHADYSIKGTYIWVGIFDNRIEITNPGGLPFGFTLDKALAGSSKIRNRVIAKVFYHLKWIEQWGRGLGLIVNECKKWGLGEPKFEELNNQFRVTLYSKKIAPKKKKVASQDWQQEFVSSLKKNKKISTKEAALMWGITVRAARLRLIKVVNTGMVKKLGNTLQDPHGAYVLVHSKNERIGKSRKDLAKKPFLLKANKELLGIKKSKSAWKELKAEQEEWDATLSDGLSNT